MYHQPDIHGKKLALRKPIMQLRILEQEMINVSKKRGRGRKARGRGGGG